MAEYIGAATLPKLIEITMRTVAALFYSTAVNIRKFAQNRQTHRQTDRQRIQLQRQLLSPVDRRGEWANNCFILLRNYLTKLLSKFGPTLHLKFCLYFKLRRVSNTFQ